MKHYRFMGKVLFVLITALSLLPSLAMAGGTAKLSIEDFTISAGETKTMVIDLSNPEDAITLVQFDLYLPAGLSIATDGGELVIDIAGRTTWRKHSLEASENSGYTRFLLYSGSNATFTGTSGAIISIDLVAASTFNGGNIQLKDILLVTPDQVESKPADLTYTIAGAPADDVTIKAKSYTRVYGEANPTFGYEVTEGTITSGTPTVTCSATRTSPVGTYDIVITKGTVSNGTVNLVKGTLTITKAPLTISAGNYTKVEGEANPTFTPTFSGFKNSETKTVLTTQPTVTTTATASSPAGIYPVTVSGAAAQNYSFNYVNGTLTVTAKPASGDIAINATNFPDANFRNYLLSQSYGSDGVITSEEIKSIKTINVGSKDISSLKGIEYFTALITLDCNDNQLTSLDVSKNIALTTLYCYNNKLLSLDVSKNTALKNLLCEDNQLTYLDISKNTALGWLCCNNNHLTSLDVSKNTSLDCLICRDNQLTSLDVSKNTGLIYLFCGGNHLTSLDVSKNKWLLELDFRNNQLTSLDVSNNTSLDHLDCGANQLTSLDVSKNTGLLYLYCGDNQLTSLDVSQNTTLVVLSCERNQLTRLNVSQNTALKSLDCFLNPLTSLDVSKNKALDALICSSNQLTSLDVSNNTALTTLDCSDNSLTSLVVSKNKALEGLYCPYNKLSALDVTKNTALTYLDCQVNQLTTLDVSKNTALTELVCYNNQINKEAMDALVNSLPVVGSGKFYVISTDSNEGNVCTKKQVTAAKQKGWTSFITINGNIQVYSGCDDNEDDNISWTEFATGNKYLNFFSNQEGFDIFPDYKLYVRADKPDVYKIADWYSGNDFVFKWDRTTNVCEVLEQATGFTHPTYGPVSLIEGALLNSSRYSDKTSYYDPTTKTFHFFPVYFCDAGSFGQFEERFEITEFVELVPLDENESVSFDGEGGIDDDEDINGNVIGNVYYNISTGKGSYDAAEGCITVTKPTDDAQISDVEGHDIFGEDFKNQFTGIVFKVPAGSGIIKVTAETSGNMTLKVKVGNSAPFEMELNGKLKISIPYNVNTPSYVYIYAGQAAGVKGQYKTVSDSEGELKLYGIELQVMENSIRGMDNEPWTMDKATIYNLSGQRMTRMRKGVNIINGRKIVVRE